MPKAQRNPDSEASESLYTWVQRKNVRHLYHNISPRPTRNQLGPCDEQKLECFDEQMDKTEEEVSVSVAIRQGMVHFRSMELLTHAVKYRNLGRTAAIDAAIVELFKPCPLLG